MKVICSKDELSKGINTVTSVTQGARNSLPVLANFLFSAEKSGIKISATDLERAVIGRIKGEIIEEGSITIPSKIFSEIIRELPSDAQIEINADESSQINIKAGKTKINLTGISAEEYPTIPGFPKDNSFSINKNTLIDMLKKTIFAVSKDPQRHVLRGIYFVIEDETFKAVATDGRRLSYIWTEGLDSKTKKKAVVPTAAVSDLLRIISGDVKDEEIKIGFSENQFGATFDDITTLAVLIDGTFPNYEQVIPKKTEISVQMNKEEILSAVKRIKTIVGEASSTDANSALVFSFDKDMLKISGSSAGIGSGETEIEIEYKDKPVEIRFNPLFIEDVLKSLGEDSLNFAFSDSLNPALITPQNNKNYLYVVMPMRV